MKAFALWLSVCLSAFGLAGGAYHVYLAEHPNRILVIIDSSYEMHDEWPRLPALVKRIEQQPYSEFALATEKQTIHRWAPRLNIDRITPYAPRTMEHLRDRSRFSIMDEADVIYLITNAAPAETATLSGITILRLPLP